MIVQYAPGTQVNCTSLLGLVSCLVNDVVKLGGTILGQLPLVNGVVALLDGNGILNLSNQSNVMYISADRPLTPSLSNAAPAVNADFAWQSELHGRWHWRGVDRQRCEQSALTLHGCAASLARRLSAVFCARKLEPQ